MKLIQKLSLIFFLFITLASVSLTCYCSLLYLEAYEVASKITVEINEISIENGNIKTSLRFINPTEFSLRVGSVWEELYLNDFGLVGKGILWIPYGLAHKLPPNWQIVLNITVPIDRHDLQPYGTWYAKIIFWLYDVPLHEWGARFVRYAFYSFK